jgi:spermidine/putrescine transport system substrate-binding protein
VVLAAGPVLSACGTDPVTTSDADGGGGGGAGTVNWSNWPLYLDTAEGDEHSHPTLAAFEQESGLEVEYTEDINCNDEFFGRISRSCRPGRAPAVTSSSSPTGWPVA